MRLLQIKIIEWVKIIEILKKYFLKNILNN